MMTPPKTDPLDETYAKMALRIFIGPRDMEWHNVAHQLFDDAPAYGYVTDAEGSYIPPADVFELAGRMLGYYAGLVPWKPED